MPVSHAKVTFVSRFWLKNRKMAKIDESFKRSTGKVYQRGFDFIFD